MERNRTQEPRIEHRGMDRSRSKDLRLAQQRSHIPAKVTGVEWEGVCVYM